MKARQSAEKHNTPGKPPVPGHGTILLAVYGKPAKVDRLLRLEVQGHGPSSAELTFMPLAATSDQQSTLGLLQSLSRFRLSAAAFNVVPEGSPGSAPVPIQVAGKLPKGVAGQPGPVLRGLAKSVAQAYTDLGSAGDEAGRWRAALLLALDGELEPRMLSELGIALSGTQGGGVFQRNAGRLVWQPYVDRQAAILEQKITKLARRNPFVARVSLSAAQALLDTSNRSLSKLAFEQLARQQGWPLKNELGEPCCAIRVERAAVAKAQDQAAASEILAAVERGDGGLNLLREQHRGQLHVIAWLLEAGQLVSSADGYIFTERELSEYWKKLKPQAGQQVAGVQDLKQSLKLGRRKAEGLRRLLVDRLGSPGQAGEAGAGQ